MTRILKLLSMSKYNRCLEPEDVTVKFRKVPKENIWIARIVCRKCKAPFKIRSVKLYHNKAKYDFHFLQ